MPDVAAKWIISGSGECVRAHLAEVGRPSLRMVEDGGDWALALWAPAADLLLPALKFARAIGTPAAHWQHTLRAQLCVMKCSLSTVIDDFPRWLES